MRQRGMSSHCGPSPRKCPFGFDTGGGRGGAHSKVDQGTSWVTENPSTRSPLRPRSRGASQDESSFAGQDESKIVFFPPFSVSSLSRKKAQTPQKTLLRKNHETSDSHLLAISAERRISVHQCSSVVEILLPDSSPILGTTQIPSDLLRFLRLA